MKAALANLDDLRARARQYADGIAHAFCERLGERSAEQLELVEPLTELVANAFLAGACQPDVARNEETARQYGETVAARIRHAQLGTALGELVARAFLAGIEAVRIVVVKPPCGPLTIHDLRAYAHNWHAIADAAMTLHKAMHDDGIAHPRARLDAALATANQARTVACACDEAAEQLEQLGGAS